MQPTRRTLMLAWFLLPAVLFSKAHAAPDDIAKYADPNLQVSEVFDGGSRGCVLVTSLNVMPNNDLLCITDLSKELAAGIGVTIAGKAATVGRISKDNGKSWGSPILVLDGAAADNNEPMDPSIVVVGGKVIVIVSVSDPPQPPPFDGGPIKLWQVTSEDNGHTWTKPMQLKIPRTRPALSGRPGIALSDGTLVVPYWWDFSFQTGTPISAGVAGTLISKDVGATWELSNDVYAEWSVEPRVLRQASEPAIVAIGDKDLFMVARSSRDDGMSHETWSHDGGRTWELPKPGAFPGFDTPTAMWRMKNGWVVRIFDNAKTWGHRYPLVASISKDNCLTWSSPRTLVDLPAGAQWPAQASYPIVVEAADGTLVMSWCLVTPDGQWRVASGRFTATWILGQ